MMIRIRKMSSMIDIHDYLNYRSYLRDIFDYKKETEKFTLRQFSRKSGFSSHAFLKQLIDGSRSASIEAASKIANGFDLSPRETEYLELLIRFDLAATVEDKNAVYARIVKYKPKTEHSRIAKKHYHLFSNWYVLAIREMVTMDKFREDERWISDQLQPKIPPKKCREAVQLLLELGYLIRNKKGKLEQSTPTLTTGAETDSLYITNYHNNMLKLASQSMIDTNEAWRDVSSLAFVIDRDDFSYIKGRIVEFRKEILEYLNDRQKSQDSKNTLQTDNSLYYLNMQLFNATRLTWKKNEQQS
jgi:uncharacterized protein (TIGR02147 family)